MKVITGEFKNRRLYVPKNRKEIKITTGLIKKVVVDIYKSKLEGAIVLDLFAGSGNVGIELLSSGADKVVFVEINPQYCKIIQKNMDMLGLLKDRQYFIIKNSVEMALKLLHNKYCFDFIYMDPPYKENLVTQSLQNISKRGIYNKNTIIIAEHHFKENIKEKIGRFKKIDSRRYGMTVLDFFLSNG